MDSNVPGHSRSPTPDQLQALFNNSTIGIVITNAAGRIVNFNAFAEWQFGYSKEEVIGQPVEMLIPQQARGRHRGYMESFHQHPQNRIMGAGRDLYALKKDGQLFPVEISLSPYLYENEHHVIAFVVDITIRKQSEQIVLDQKSEILQMNAELESKVDERTKMLRNAMQQLEQSRSELHQAFEKERELGELKSRFVTMASHEFRTPLSTILSSAYIIEQYTSGDDQTKRLRHLDKIRGSVQTLTFILEDFLSLEKLEKGFVKPTFLPLPQAAMQREIESTLEELSPILKTGQTFDFQLESYLEFETDPKLLKNILLNLLSNAIKYSPENSIITLRLFADENSVSLEISDQGMGIPGNEQAQLFERFFRATNALEIQGTGLGLHIVQKYLAILKGSIEMQSRLNEGSVFTVTFALER